MKRSHLLLSALAFALFVSLGVHSIVKNNTKIQLKDIELRSASTDLKTLQLKYDNLNIELDKTDKSNTQQIKKLEDEKSQLQNQLQDAQKQIQARADEKVRLASLSASQTVYAAAAPLQAVIQGCGDNADAQYIYQHESGCNLNAVNSIGCRGIGQACPGSKLPCGADYACQNAYFSNYAITRYGSWSKAAAFWRAHSWW